MLDGGAFGMSCVAGVVFVKVSDVFVVFLYGCYTSLSFSKSHEIAYLLAV